MQAEIRLRKKRGFGDIISDAFDYFKIHWKNLFKYLSLTALPIYVLGSIVAGLGMRFNPAVNSDPGKVMSFIAFLYGGFFIIMLGFVFMTWIVIEYMNLSLHLSKDEITLKKVMKGLTKSLGYYILGTFLIGIILFVSAIFFMIPSIYFGVVFSIFFFAIGIERIDPGAAITRSFELIRGRWWYTFLLSIPVGIIQFSLTYSLLIPFHGAQWLRIYFSSSSDMLAVSTDLFSILSTVVGFIVMSLGYVFPAIACGVNYFSLVERREEKGLKERIEAITPVYEA